MKKVRPIKLIYAYADLPESGERLRRVYGKVFARARENILKRHLLQREEVGLNASDIVRQSFFKGAVTAVFS